MEALNLTHGKHKSPEEGMCLRGTVAYLAGEEHSDRPECACPVIALFGRVLLDRMGNSPTSDALRAKHLTPLASRLVGTRSTPGVEAKRAYFFADRAVRLFAPMALESAGLTDEAASLRGLPEIVDKKTARNADAAAWVAVASADEAGAADAADAAFGWSTVCASASHASWAAAGAWEQAAQVLAQACEITEGGG